MADRDQLKNGNWICVLNDGETYTGLSGSYIAILTAEQDKELNEGTEPNQLHNLQQHELNELLDWAIDNGYFD
jgi:hypothetical protein